jgi:hypothetical protein
LIDRQYLSRPYYGFRCVAAWLATRGHVVKRKRVQRLMAIYQQPNTSKAAAGRKVPVSPWWDHDRAGQSGVVFGRHPRLKPALSELKAEDLSRYNGLYNRHMTAEGNQFVALEISKLVTKR